MTTIITNNVPRPIIYGYELSEKERKEFDFLNFDENKLDHDNALFDQFFRYKEQVYYLGDFLSIGARMRNQQPPNDDPFWEWDGYASDSYFSGLVIKCPNDEQVIVGTYFS